MRAQLVGLSVLVLSACGGAAYSERDRDATRETDTRSNQPAAPALADGPSPGAPSPDGPASDEPDDNPTAAPEDDPAPPFAGNGGLQDQGGGFGCTEVGCLSGFQLQIEKQSPWQPGSYTFIARGDNGLEQRCDLRLTALDMLLYEGCNGFFMTREDDSPVPASATIQLVSDEVELEVLLDGQRIGFAEYEPTWTEHRPNGPRCEPVCENGGRQVVEVE